MSGKIRLFSFLFLTSILILFLCPNSDAHELPPQTVAQLKEYRQKKKLDPSKVYEAGALFECKPYCRVAATVFFVNEKKYPDGLQIIPEKGYENLAGRKMRFYPVQSRPYIAYFGMRGTPKVSSKVSDPDLTSEITDAELRYRYYPKHLLVEIHGGPWFGSRTLKLTPSDANTQSEVDSTGHSGVRLGIYGRSPSFYKIKRYVLFGDLRIDSYGNNQETQLVNTNGQVAASDYLDFRPRAFVNFDRTEIAVGLTTGFRRERYLISPENYPRSFSSTRLFGYVGGFVNAYGLEVEYINAFYSNVNDISTYRGTSVGASLSELTFSGCFRFGFWLKFVTAACGWYTMRNWSETGAGPPALPVFTVTPVYAFQETMYGFHLSLTRPFKFLDPPDKKGKKEEPSEEKK